MKSFSYKLTIVAVSFISFAQNLIADDAAVLPQGRWRLRVMSSFSEAENKISSGGETTPLGSSFTRNINGQLISALTANPQLQAVSKLNPALLAETIAELQSDISTKIYANVFVAEYGFTDRLSAGLIVPLVYGETEVVATSNGTTEFKQKIRAATTPQEKALRSQLLDSTSVDSINRVLTDQFRYSDGLKSWQGWGLGDIEAGVKYNYFKTPYLQLTLKTGVRMPTGRADDPNSLMDMGYGDGQFDLGFFSYADYHMNSQFFITWEAGYTSQLPNSQTMRLPLSADLPIGSQSFKLDRNLGDFWETGLEANFSATKRIIVSSKYRFKQKFSDSYSNGNGLDLSLLELDTNQILHEANFQLEYTNLAAVRAGAERIPYGVTAFYRLPFAGKNISDIRTAGLQLKTYF